VLTKWARSKSPACTRRSGPWPRCPSRRSIAPMGRSYVPAASRAPAWLAGLRGEVKEEASARRGMPGASQRRPASHGGAPQLTTKRSRLLAPIAWTSCRRTWEKSRKKENSLAVGHEPCQRVGAERGIHGGADWSNGFSSMSTLSAIRGAPLRRHRTLERIRHGERDSRLRRASRQAICKDQ